ncbi:MAG: protein-methionine-sulfoxide reductase catalytic subunit MsrP [Magnetovibrionaceae bacterium]
MLIRFKRQSDPKPSEITPHAAYQNRRSFIKGGLAAGAGLALTGLGLPGSAEAVKLDFSKKGFGSIDDAPTPLKYVKTYNNFYELGTDKGDPANNASLLKTDPWTVEVDGLCAKPGKVSVDDLIKPHALEERIYRLRCVEAWSMVVPWVGFPLADLIKRFEPLGSAKYVAFETLHDPEMLPTQRRPIIKWPYNEGLRMDEALHPLTLVSVGLYGETLPNQNGAPIRLVVPWKYGFKSIKSIVRISFMEKEPPTAWNTLQPSEYGFYSNVNPTVDHPRWSQKTERVIDGSFFSPRRDTEMFNGYAEEVASLYEGMDLAKYY